MIYSAEWLTLGKTKAINPEVIANISVISSLLPILAFLLLKRNWTERLKWVCFCIILVSLMADLVNEYLASHKQSNLWVINIYFLVDSLLIFYFFFRNFKGRHTYQRLIMVLLTVLVISWCWHVFNNGIRTLDSWSNGVETLSIIVLSILFFYDQLTKPESLFVYSTPVFWIVVGVLVYKAGTFFLFLYFNTLEQSEKEIFGNYYIINSAFLMLRNILFTIAFTIRDQPKKQAGTKTLFSRKVEA